MRETPDPAQLYPEIAAHGSLAAALHASAASQGLSLEMTPSSSETLTYASMTSLLPHREMAIVIGWKFERRWWLNASAANGILLSGTTSDLDQLPGVIAGWVTGASLEEIGRASPFEVLTGRLEVPDGNPAGVIAAEWQWLLKDAEEADWPEYQALIEAAYAEPRLRALYPYTSHWQLNFSARPFPFTPSFAGLRASKGGEYSVQDGMHGETLAEVAGATEAVAMAVERIPERFDPPRR